MSNTGYFLQAEKLKLRLSETLPGSESHIKMAPPGRFPKENIPKPNETTRVGAVLLLLYPDDKGNLHFPLIVRALYEGVHSGQVAFPGGKRDGTDDDIIHTALRETLEEIGVDVTRADVLGQLSEIYIPPSNFLVYPTIALLDKRPTFKLNEREVDKVFEVQLETLQDKTLQQLKNVNFKGVDILLPYYQINEYEVWGATAMILSEFAEIWEEISL